MDKKNIKRIVIFSCAAVLVLALAVMPLAAKRNAQTQGPQVSILRGTVETGTVSTELLGGGTLAEQEAVTVTVPKEVKLTKFLVANGHRVSEGDSLAGVDRVSVMRAITQVQDTLAYLTRQLHSASADTGSQTLTAPAQGTVKLVYAREGDSVRDVMLQYGALAVLSLDGLMAVDLEIQTDLTPGASVTVTLSGGTQVPGRVAKNLAGILTVTVEDAGYTVGEAARIDTGDGTCLGSGPLYISSPWNAAASSGTVDSVSIREGDRVSAGGRLMVLSDVGASARYRQLLGQRQEYEELMLELFQMYQTQTLTAPCDGVVSGIDENSIQLLSDTGGQYGITLLANAPNGDDETLYRNYVGKVAAVSDSGWALLINPQSIPIADYTDLSAVPLEESAMTQLRVYPNRTSPAREEAPPEETQPEETQPTPPMESVAPIYASYDGGWQQIPFSAVAVGDILLFAADGTGEFVWIVRVNAPESPAFPSGGFPSGGFSQKTPQPSFQPYGLDTVTVAAVTPQDTIKLTVAIDELDIGKLSPGMTALVTVDALGGEKHSAVITGMGSSGTNNGGSSKFTVELTMERRESMLPGMNASASIVLSERKDVLTVPAAALVEQGSKTLVYTGYDPETGTLHTPVTVTVGRSDGETVEILEGLTLGQTYYYACYTAPELSATPEFGFPFG